MDGRSRTVAVDDVLACQDVYVTGLEDMFYRKIALAVIIQAVGDLGSVNRHVRAAGLEFVNSPAFSFWCGVAALNCMHMRGQLRERGFDGVV